MGEGVFQHDKTAGQHEAGLSAKQPLPTGRPQLTSDMLARIKVLPAVAQQQHRMTCMPADEIQHAWPQ